MKRLLLLLLLPCALFGQGVYIPARSVQGTVNGITRPMAGATVTVCAANTGGIPCSPALANTVFKDSALTIPLTNPFFTDANGNYPQAALAGGTYTITESAAGYVGFSYQVSVSCTPGGCTVGALTATTGAFSGAVTAQSVTAQNLDTLYFCDNAAFANTAACQTAAGTTGGMLFPPNYTIGAFTNPNFRPVFDFTRVDWRGFYNVRDFGAKGDGSTDDTTAIQNAINFACGGSFSTPTNNACTNALTNTALASGAIVYFPAATYKITVPLVTYSYVVLQGAGKEATKIVKTTNSVGTFPSITAGTGVGRTATSCGGAACVDSYQNDAIIEVAYTTLAPTGYAYEWSIRDMSLWSNATNGAKFGIYAPRAAQSDIRNVHINLNCLNGNPSSCGSVQGSCYQTHDAWLMVHDKVTCDSAYKGWEHADDGSGNQTGTSAIFSNDYGVNIGCAGFQLNLGPAYSTLMASAVDHFNTAGTDLPTVDLKCAPYAFNTVGGISIVGGGSESIKGGVMYAASSSVTVSGGFKTFAQTGFTSAGTLATVFMDNSQVTMNGTQFSAATSPGNLLNMVIQNGATLIDSNTVLPSGGNSFIGFGGGSLEIDQNNGGVTVKNSTQNNLLTGAGESLLEQSAATAASGRDVDYGDSTNHCKMLSDNGDNFRCLSRDATNSGNTVQVSGSDFTTANNTSLQVITGLSWTLINAALNYSFDCEISYSQATAAAAVAFGIQAASANPTNIFGTGIQQITVGPPATYVSGTLATLATTTATAIVSGTPGAQATLYTVHLGGRIENSANANVINIVVSTAAGADAVTVKRGSSCTLIQR